MNFIPTFKGQLRSERMKDGQKGKAISRWFLSLASQPIINKIFEFAAALITPWLLQSWLLFSVPRIR